MEIWELLARGDQDQKICITSKDNGFEYVGTIKEFEFDLETVAEDDDIIDWWASDMMYLTVERDAK